MVKVAVLGFGVVGSGTVSVLDKNADTIMQNAGQKIEVKYVLDIRDFPESKYSALFASDFETIVGDPDIQIVVEAIGGTDAALDYTKRSLKAGKNVVTSNKELVAEYGSELLEIAKANNVNYLFEASVGGGIPVIRPLIQCMSANSIKEIYGILNGTTNYVLTDMYKNGADFSGALKEAQAKGYAEADPTADVDGIDACRKICILASIAFGRHIHPKDVPTEGIRGVTRADMSIADKLGYRLKLLGRARAVGDKVSVYVAPHLVGAENLLAIVNGVMNGVVIRGNAVGDVVLCGAGAGKLPTASAVVADVIDEVKHLHSRRWISWGGGDSEYTTSSDSLESAFYIRTAASRERIEHSFGNVRFATDNHTGGKETAFITNVMSEKKLHVILGDEITALSKFRVLSDH